MTHETFARIRSATAPQTSVTRAGARARWRRPRVLGAAAIIVALVVLVTLFVLRRAQLEEHAATISIHVNDVVQLLADDALGLPPDHAHAWEAGASSRWTSQRARAVRIGARHADVIILSGLRTHQTELAYYGRDSLALALVARSSDRATVLAAENARELARLRGGDRAAEAYGWAAAEAARREFWGYAAWLAGQRMPPASASYVVLGGWLEAARVAVHRGDRAFFERPESRAIAAAMVQLPRLSRDERAALERVRALIEGAAIRAGDATRAEDGSRAALTELQEALTRALVLLAD